ncbi:MAG: PfaD family polyunsaturated fatty acid/polyketide biosynthesis protein [Desulfobacterales bacterium]|nr:MAG: PfaD family polyunsaturated fatty acid/polyketide biosynthesis protein [Desulfobacterales bacterium]
MEPSIKGENLAGWWIPDDTEPEQGDDAVRVAILKVIHPVFLLNLNGLAGVGRGGRITIGGHLPSESKVHPLTAYAPPLHPKDLGDPLFKATHKLRYAYIVGAMANGITSVDMVEDAGRAGMVGFFGSAGLTLNSIEAAIDQLQKRLGRIPFGFNLIHSPHDPDLEFSTVQLYLQKGIKLISASAFLDLTLPLVYYRVKGIYRDNAGNIVCPNKVIAKVSRVEVAKKYLSPPPVKLLDQLVARKLITQQEASLASSIPVAEDITAEADSGGHTDNRPAIALLPTMLALKDELTKIYQYKKTPCVGLAGGIATPESAAAAFALGAAFILTGSINQSCVEAGTSEIVRIMLSEASQADVTMAPAADMFELGVKVQVLKRGTMFPLRAAKLYDLYSSYDCLEDIPEQQKEILERDYFRCDFQEEWQQTKDYFCKMEPKQIERGEQNPKHKMALVFRSYLGQSSIWAISGDPSRKIDYQIWCGPAMGAFNQWVKGSFLEKPEYRKTVTVAMNLLYGAAVATRVNWLRFQGAVIPADVGSFSPMTLPEILNLLE